MNRQYGSDTPSASKQAEAQQQAQLKQARIFQRVLGTEGKRTDDQKFVMDLIAQWGWYNIPYSQAGPVTTDRVMNMEGMREIFLCIKTACDFDFESIEKAVPKVDTSSQVGK